MTETRYQLIKGAPLNVKDFGATGNGVTDDTTAIQAALDAVASYGSLFFPSGNYIISDELTLNTSNILLTGTQARITQNGANKKTLNFTDVSFVKICNLDFYGKGTEHDGASTSYNGVAAIYFTNPTNITIEGCTFQNHAGGSIRWTGTAETVSISECSIKGIGSGEISSGDNNGDVAVGSQSATEDNNIIIAGNDIEGHCFGIFLARGSGASILSNNFHDIPGQHAVYCSSQSGVTCTGNTFKDIALDGVKNQISADDTTVEGVVVGGNVMKDMGGNGINLGVSGAYTGSSFTGVVLTGNSLDACGSYGIALDNGEDAIISGNTILNSEGYGIYWVESSGDINGNVIKNTEWNGMRLSLRNDARIQNNTIIDAAVNAGEAGAGLDVAHYVYCSRGGSYDVAQPKIIFTNNTFTLAGSTPPEFTHCVRTSDNLDIYWLNNINITTEGWYFGNGSDLKIIDIGYGASDSYTVGDNLDPATPIYGRGRRELYGEDDPDTASMTDTFMQGDVCWNSTPTASGTMGWVCTAAGTPGTWKAFGAIDA